jgi:nicotinate dehydrogenase subunit A
VARFQISVNGRERTVEVPADATLLEVLRDELGLTGAKYGCGEGRCGACAVLVDGEEHPACRIAIADVGARTITTIEGLATGPVVDAFVAEGALQCGYCTPGLVVAATALLARTPDPGEDEIRAALAGHLCRCGVHGRVIRAVRRAAEGSR